MTEKHIALLFSTTRHDFRGLSRLLQDVVLNTGFRMRAPVPVNALLVLGLSTIPGRGVNFYQQVLDKCSKGKSKGVRR